MNKIGSDEQTQSSESGGRAFVLIRIGRRARNIKDDLAILFRFMLGQEYLNREGGFSQSNGCS